MSRTKVEGWVGIYRGWVEGGLAFLRVRKGWVGVLSRPIKGWVGYLTLSDLPAPATSYNIFRLHYRTQPCQHIIGRNSRHGQNIIGRFANFLDNRRVSRIFLTSLCYRTFSRNCRPNLSDVPLNVIGRRAEHAG